MLSRRLSQSQSSQSTFGWTRYKKGQTDKYSRTKRAQAARPHLAVDRLDYFLRSRGSKVVVLALVANTMVAQLLYNSAGQLVLGNQVLLGYLIISAVCSTFAFALFEVTTIFQLHDLMALDASIKAEIGAEKLIKRGYFVLAVSCADQLPLGALLPGPRLAHRLGVGTKFPLDDLPQPWNWLYYAVHASAYTAVLFLAGIFGERPKSAKR